MDREDHVKKVNIVFGLLLMLTAAASAKAQESNRKYIGRSGCDKQFDYRTRFGIRLDKSQNTYLDYREIGKVGVLLLLQFKREDSQCGVIQDAIEIRDLSKTFQFDCVDHKHLGEIVVGLTKVLNGDDVATTSNAWRIDLRERKFNAIREKVQCMNGNYSGDDDGNDLADTAARRVSEEKSGQHGASVQH